MSDPGPDLMTRRSTWLVTFYAYQVGIALLGLVSYFVTQGGDEFIPFDVRLIAYLGGAIAYSASAGMALYRMRLSGDPTEDLKLTPQRFQTLTLVTLGIGEVGTLLGLGFVGFRSCTQFLIFPAANIAINLLLVLPEGKAYWSWMDSRSDR